MSAKSILLAGAVAAVLGFAAAPAHADNIVLNQWYTGGFTTLDTALFGPGFTTSVHGPVLPGGFADAIAAPGAPWVITLTHDGFLTVTDVETSGDQFQLFDNGVPMTPTTGLLGGQPGENTGITSNPVPFATSACGEDIACALSNADYSSGTFLLHAGVNSITGLFLGVVGNGDFNFIAEVPEPATIALLGVGLLGLGLVRRRT